MGSALDNVRMGLQGKNSTSTNIFLGYGCHVYSQEQSNGISMKCFVLFKISLPYSDSLYPLVYTEMHVHSILKFFLSLDIMYLRNKIPMLVCYHLQYRITA